MESNKDTYQRLCEEYDQIPIFFQPWWLDIVTVSGDWDVIVCEEKSNSIIGVLPFVLTRKLNFKVSVMPPLTPYLGPFIFFTQDGKHQFIFQNMVNCLFDQLPGLDYYAQRWLPDILKCNISIPEEYEETARYTYQLNYSDEDKAYSGFYPDVKNKIRKSSESYDIKIEDTATSDILTFYEAFCRRKNIEFTLPLFHLQKLINESTQRKQGIIYKCINKENGEIIGFQFTVNDKKYAYNLLLAIDANHQQEGIAQKLLWRSIHDSLKTGLQYDFEGSMIPGVSSLFKHFGADHIPYSKVYRDRNKVIKAARIISGMGD